MDDVSALKLLGRFLDPPITCPARIMGSPTTPTACTLPPRFPPVLTLMRRSYLQIIFNLGEPLGGEGRGVV